MGHVIFSGFHTDDKVRAFININHVSGTNEQLPAFTAIVKPAGVEHHVSWWLPAIPSVLSFLGFSLFNPTKSKSLLAGDLRMAFGRDTQIFARDMSEAKPRNA